MNKIVVVQDDIEIEAESYSGVKVEWLGDNAILKIYSPCTFVNSTIQIGNNGLVEVGKNSNIRNLFCRCASDCSKVIIGKNFNIESGQFILARGQKNQSIVIGDNCLFSSSIFIQTSDGHAILDKNGKVLNNTGGHISIGNHCWLGHSVSVLKKASIPDDVVVAESAVVTKKYTRSNCILGGVPAKILKVNIYWDIRAPELMNGEK